MEVWVVWASTSTWSSQPALWIHNSSLAAGNCFLSSSLARVSSCAGSEDKRVSGWVLQGPAPAGSQILSL